MGIERQPESDSYEVPLDAREPIALVVDMTDRQLDIVTLEDLLEAMLGIDIADKPVRVSNRRQASEEARRRRLERLRQKRGWWALASDESSHEK